MERLVMIGRDYPDLGIVAQSSLGTVQACVSAGSDPDSPSFAYKGDKICPNEDGLVVLRQGEMWLLAVADGHLGHQSSHALLDGLAGLDSIPARLGRLSLVLSSAEWLEDTAGGTTLLVVCVNERNGEVFGLSFGDSSLILLEEGRIQLLNQLNNSYLRGGGAIQVETGRAFQFKMGPGQRLLLYTDGVNECCYRDPHRSVAFRHLQQLQAEHGDNIADFTRAVVELALSGVDGHPGGQDNIVAISFPFHSP